MKKKPVPQKSLPDVRFCIDAIDPLGQGVFKDNGNIGFIAKTLPGETGTAKLLKARKGVLFARYKTLDTLAPERIEAECPHYGECPGCHYQHTDYSNELHYKKQSLEHLLKKLNIPNDIIEVIPAPSRLAYRNRIQLHYRNNKIGLIDGLTDTVVEIPQCKILRDELKPALENLYNTPTWQKEQGKEGHCELYLKDETVSLEWNKSYSHGGFTQVYEAMNQRLCEEVGHELQQGKPESVLDLFSGDGNLTNKYAYISGAKRTMVDATPNPHKDFIALDLFASDAFKKFQEQCTVKQFDTIILDPPRKGFTSLNTWVNHLKPKQLIYVSCNPATLARDLQSIEGKYRIEKVQLLDLFPNTYHFETMVTLRFKKH